MTTTTAPLSNANARHAGMAQALVLICCTVLPIMGIISLAPVLPKLLQHFESTPHSQFLVPAALTIPALCIAIFSWPVGMLTDRMGRKPLLVFGLLLYAFFGVMPLWLESLNAIVASRAGLGVSEALIMTTTTTLSGDYFTPAERRKWIAFQAAMGSLAASALFGIGGALGQISWSAPFYLYLLALPICLAVVVVLWEPKTAPRAVVSRGAVPDTPFPWKAFAGVCFVTFIGATAFYVAPIHLGRVLSEIGISEPARIGMAAGLGSLGVPIGAVLYHRLGARHGVATLIGASLLLIGLPMVAMNFTTNFFVILPLFFVNQLGSGMVLPTLINWCLSHLVFAWRGRGVGLWNSVFFISQFLTPIIFSGVVIAAGGVVPAFAVLGAIGAAFGIVVWLSRVQAGAVAPDELPDLHGARA